MITLDESPIEDDKGHRSAARRADHWNLTSSPRQVMQELEKRQKAFAQLDAVTWRRLSTTGPLSMAVGTH